MSVFVFKIKPVTCCFQLVRIIKKQRQLEKRGGLSSFDPKCTILVCNKWDLVKKQAEKNETTVWEDIKEKLTDLFPNISEDQIFKMSVTEVGSFDKEFKI